MLYPQKNTHSRGNPQAVVKRAGILFALGLSAICAWSSPVFADENELIEAQHRIDDTKLQFLHLCQQQQVALRRAIVDNARDTLAKKCEKDSDCPGISVSTLTSPSGDSKGSDNDSFNFHFKISVYRNKPEPVLSTDSGAPTTLEKMVKSKLDKACIEPLNNSFQSPNFYTFADVPYQAPDELTTNALEEIARAQRLLSGDPGRGDRARVVAGTGIKGSPAPASTNDQGPTTSPRDTQAQNLTPGAN